MSFAPALSPFAGAAQRAAIRQDCSPFVFLFRFRGAARYSAMRSMASSTSSAVWAMEYSSVIPPRISS